MNKASKVETILNAWLEFIDLVDLNNAKVSRNTAVLSGVKLVGNHVQINRSDFSDLKREVSEEMGQEDQYLKVASYHVSVGYCRENVSVLVAPVH